MPEAGKSVQRSGIVRLLRRVELYAWAGLSFAHVRTR